MNGNHGRDMSASYLMSKKGNNVNKKKIAVLCGDGIGPEVVGAACHILERSGFALDIIQLPNGEAALAEYGTVLPEAMK